MQTSLRRYVLPLGTTHSRTSLSAHHRVFVLSARQSSPRPRRAARYRHDDRVRLLQHGCRPSALPRSAHCKFGTLGHEAHTHTHVSHVYACTRQCRSVADFVRLCACSRLQSIRYCVQETWFVSALVPVSSAALRLSKPHLTCTSVRVFAIAATLTQSSPISQQATTISATTFLRGSDRGRWCAPPWRTRS